MNQGLKYRQPIKLQNRWHSFARVSHPCILQALFSNLKFFKKFPNDFHRSLFRSLLIVFPNSEFLGIIISVVLVAGVAMDETPRFVYHNGVQYVLGDQDTAATTDMYSAVSFKSLARFLMIRFRSLQN